MMVLGSTNKELEMTTGLQRAATVLLVAITTPAWDVRYKYHAWVAERPGERIPVRVNVNPAYRQGLN
jgi:hypothetical protein